jgi:hypothetical protein
MEAEPDASETLAAIMEMAEERYICTVEEHDPETDDYLLVWTDNAEQEWGCWFSRSLIEDLFSNVVLN